MGFIDAVDKHVQEVFTRCTLKNGTLLSDGLDLSTVQPLIWEGNILSNLACQQNFLRTLDALGTLTGNDKYHNQADEWIRCALDKIHDIESDLFYWGGHTSYGL